MLYNPEIEKSMPSPVVVVTLLPLITPQISDGTLEQIVRTVGTDRILDVAARVEACATAPAR